MLVIPARSFAASTRGTPWMTTFVGISSIGMTGTMLPLGREMKNCGLREVSSGVIAEVSSNGIVNGLMIRPMRCEKKFSILQQQLEVSCGR
jgi:hypothetical protein